jgi:hypothetical protein
MAESLNNRTRQRRFGKKENLGQKRRECEDTTYSRDDRHACYRWAEKKTVSGPPRQGGSHAAKT